MHLSEIWFVLIAVLFVGFVFLEGFDFGVGMSTRFLAKNEQEKRQVINSIGPFWDANEVWLITAGGAMFAAFPHWYATLFSGFYLPFVLLLLAFIARGVAFEFRDKVDSAKWVKIWDYAILAGSFLPPLLLGVMFASLIKGLPIDQEMNMYASFLDIINVYTVTGGILFVLLTYLHGLMFLTLKTEGPIRERAAKQAKAMLLLTGLVTIGFVVMTSFFTNVIQEKAAILIPLYMVAVLCFLLLFVTLGKKKEGLSFTLTGIMLIIVTSSFFVGLFPNVMMSSLDANFNMSIVAAASGDYSLKIMTIVAATMIPIVLAYTIWSYYVFRKRVSNKEHLEY